MTIKPQELKRLKSDKLAPIREIFQIFVNNCHKSYSIFEYATVDEMLAAFQERCNF